MSIDNLFEKKAELDGNMDYYGNPQFYPKRGNQLVFYEPDRSGPIRLLVTSTEDGVIDVWNLRIKERVRRLETKTTFIDSLAVGYNGKDMLIAFSTHEHKIMLWNLSTGEQKNIGDHRCVVYNLTFSQSGRYLASASSDRTCLVWEIDHDGEYRQIHCHKHANWVRCVVFFADDWLLTGCDDGYVRKFGLQADNDKAVIFSVNNQNLMKKVFSVALSENLSNDDTKIKIAIGSDQCYAYVCEFDTERLLQTLDHTRILSIKNICFSPDNKYLVTDNCSDFLRIWDMETDAKDGNMVNIIKKRGVADSKCVLCVPAVGKGTTGIWVIYNTNHDVKIVDLATTEELAVIEPNIINKRIIKMACSGLVVHNLDGTFTPYSE